MYIPVLWVIIHKGQAPLFIKYIHYNLINNTDYLYLYVCRFTDPDLGPGLSYHLWFR